jgi:hypothetical protein
VQRHRIDQRAVAVEDQSSAFRGWDPAQGQGLWARSIRPTAA